ncbi:PhnD/SsuA/transferrin family substrate-binding protein [Piscinibacter sp. XHJ-5]|uniref:PhnD/SsuA/transferrin family substrate-binding protein n=1 Tax=Piscinibacter sp. XHJ-5 TaxID=3037797 RepID=UPI0024533549|nr:PhnD/SsuA/transferrin family substrate-binding protein [Piscinibacter sp. XHJ-5]
MRKLFRVISLMAAAAAVMVCSFHAAAAGATKFEEPLLLGINEGATDSRSADDLRRQYASLAKVLARIAGKSVIVEPYVDVALFRKKFDEGAFHFAFGKSVHVVAKGVVGGKYVPLVKNERAYVAGVVVQKGSTIKDLRGLRGKTLVLPPADTYTSALVETLINELGLPFVVQNETTGYAPPRPDTIAIRHFRIQDNVAKSVAVGLFPAGAVNPSVLARVEKQASEGGIQWKDTELIVGGPGVQVLTKLKPQTGWLLVGSAELPPQVIERATATLSALSTHEEGKQVLKDIGCANLVRSTKEEYVALINYLYH